MHKIKIGIFFVGILALVSLNACGDTHVTGAQAAQAKPKPTWAAADCKKVSDGSGSLLTLSGQMLEHSDKSRKDGDGAKADELNQAALFFSQIAADYATNYQAYCKP